MREIKFRAWDLDNCVMYYQDRNQDNGEGPLVWWCKGGEVFFEETATYTRNCGGVYDEDVTIDDHRPEQTVMQYTGLKDKNGVEIYEGDIMLSEAHSGLGLCVIEWDQKDCCFIGSPCKPDGEWIRSSRGTGVTRGEFGFPGEVIGNIHENAELFK
jgi:uncharacterized phage protein (TIGR01671 family)